MNHDAFNSVSQLMENVGQSINILTDMEKENDKSTTRGFSVKILHNV